MRLSNLPQNLHLSFVIGAEASCCSFPMKNYPLMLCPFHKKAYVVPIEEPFSINKSKSLFFSDVRIYVPKNSHNGLKLFLSFNQCLAALAALYLTFVSQWVTTTLEF